MRAGCVRVGPMIPLLLRLIFGWSAMPRMVPPMCLITTMHGEHEAHLGECDDVHSPLVSVLRRVSERSCNRGDKRVMWPECPRSSEAI